MSVLDELRRRCRPYTELDRLRQRRDEIDREIAHLEQVEAERSEEIRRSVAETMRRSLAVALGEKGDRDG